MKRISAALSILRLRDPQKRHPPLTLSAIFRATILALIFALSATSLTGCALRIDTGPPRLPKLTLWQQERNRAASSEDVLVKASEKLAAKNPAFSKVAAGAKERLRLLGGVWEPWPKGAPKGAQTLPPAPALASTPKDVFRALTAGVKEAAAASLADLPADQVQIFASLAGARQADAVALAKALALPSPTDPTSAVTPPKAAKDAPQVDPPSKSDKEKLLKSAGDALAVIDQARWTIELIGAQQRGGAASYAELRAPALENFMSEAVAAGIKDTREPGYAPPGSLDQGQVVKQEKRALHAQLVVISALSPKDRLPALRGFIGSTIALQSLGHKLSVFPGLEDQEAKARTNTTDG